MPFRTSQNTQTQKQVTLRETHAGRGSVTWAGGLFMLRMNGLTWVRGGCYWMKGWGLNVTQTHFCWTLYLGWAAAFPPGPASSVKGRTPSRRSWHRKTAWTTEGTQSCPETSPSPVSPQGWSEGQKHSDLYFTCKPVPAWLRANSRTERALVTRAVPTGSLCGLRGCRNKYLVRATVYAPYRFVLFCLQTACIPHQSNCN